MRKLLVAIFILFSIASFAQNDTTKYFNSVDYGWKYQRIKAKLSLTIPTDTTQNKLIGSIASINGVMYIKSLYSWDALIIGSSSTFIQNQTSSNQSGGFRVSNDSYIHGLRLGLGAGNIYSNTVFGDSSLVNNTTGYWNSAYSFNALYSNTVGFGNTAMGVSALKFNTDGNNNTSVGHGALFSNVHGSQNTVFGYRPLYNNEGSNNINIGYYNSSDATTMSNSTIIGNAIYIGNRSNQIVLSQGSNIKLRYDSTNWNIYGRTNINNASDNGATALNVLGSGRFSDTLIINKNNLTPSYLAGTTLGIVGADATANRAYMDAFGSNSVIHFRRANGTQASPTTLVAGNNMGSISAFGYDGTAYGSATKIAINFNAGETWTTSANGTYMSFVTAANGNTVANEKMRLYGDGTLLLNTTSTDGYSKLIVNGVATASRVNVNGATDNSNFPLNNSGVTNTGGISMQGTTFSTSTTLTTNYFLWVFNGAAGQTLSLPTSTGNNGMFLIKNNTSNSLSIATGGGTSIQTLAGTSVTSYTLAANGVMYIISNGGSIYIQII